MARAMGLHAGFRPEETMSFSSKHAYLPGSPATMATSAGEVEVPILYGRTAYFMAVFRVDHAAAQRLVDPFQLQAVALPRARSVAVLTFAAYSESTIGPYLETGLAIAAVPAGADPSVRSLLSLWRSTPGAAGIGYAILHLPATTELACAAGREIWGYPKFVTTIQAALDDSHFQGEVADPASSARLLRLAGRTGWAVPSPPLDVLLYSRRDDTLLQAVVETQGMGWLCMPGTVGLVAAPGSHPMSATLGLLGMHEARPAVVFRDEALRMRLHQGTEVSA